MTSLSSDDLLAALQLQYDWGVDAVVEENVWQPLSPMPAQLFESKAQPAPRTIVPSVQSLSLSSSSRSESILAARDVPELLRLSEHIEGVSLSRTASHRLKPHYVDHAPFMIVGDVPDADEDRSGRLFAGKAGELLECVLASVGLHREQLSIVPSIPWRPPGGQRVAARDVTACLPILQRSIALGSPARLVTMGTTPMQMVLNTSERLSRVRGRWTEVRVPGLEKPLPVFPMLHPLQLMGAPLLRRHVWRDLLELTESLE